MNKKLVLLFLLLPLFALADISNVDLSVGTSGNKKNVQVYDRNNRHTQTISDVNGTKKFYDRNNRLETQAYTRGNTTTFRAANGKRIGTAVKRGNSTVYYNDRNQRVKTLTNESSGNQRFSNSRNSNVGSKSGNRYYNSQNRQENSTSSY